MAWSEDPKLWKRTLGLATWITLLGSGCGPGFEPPFSDPGAEAPSPQDSDVNFDGESNRDDSAEEQSANDPASGAPGSGLAAPGVSDPVEATPASGVPASEDEDASSGEDGEQKDAGTDAGMDMDADAGPPSN